MHDVDNANELICIMKTWKFIESKPMSINNWIFVIGPIAGYLIERYGCRVTMFCGVFLASSGLFSSSFATSVYHLYITYGIIAGG